MKSSTAVILLGTGTPNADPDRSGPSVAIVVDEIPYIFDCGPGVVRQAAAAGIKMHTLTRAFITHLHSDHTAGYPDLIFTPWVLERVNPLEVYGPPGIKDMTEHILKAYTADINERLYGLEPANTTGYTVNAYEIESGTVYTDSRVSIHAFPVNHGMLQAFAFKVETPDKTIVISGDTAPTERMVKESKGCDILIHEVYSHKGLESRPGTWQKYHLNVHTSSRELAHIASKACPHLLVLYHQLFWGVSENELLQEIKEIYDGKMVSGKDLDIY
jgi:ribonuclease BN (tRNA processing enzyme)